MQGNDLSNRCAPTIAFRVEDTIFNEEETVLDKLIGKFRKYRKSQLNPQAISNINWLFKFTDYRCIAIVDKCNLSPSLYTVLEDYPISEIVVVDKLIEINMMLNVKEIYYYVDCNSQRALLLSNRGVIDLDTFESLFR